MGFGKIFKVFDLWSDAKADQAAQSIRDGLPTDFLIAKDREASEQRHGNVQAAAGKVVAQQVAIQGQLDQLVARAGDLRGLIETAGREYTRLKDAGQTDKAQNFYNKGAALSSELAGVVNEIKTTSKLLAEAKAAAESARQSAAAADQQLTVDRQHAQSLAIRQQQAALARATSASVRALNEAATGSAGSPYGSAAARIDREFAEAMGEKDIMSNSGVAQEAELRALAAQQAGAGLFEQVLADPRIFDLDEDGDGVPDWMQEHGEFAPGGKYYGFAPGQPAPATASAPAGGVPDDAPAPAGTAS
jgi:hypothetical protein